MSNKSKLNLMDESSFAFEKGPSEHGRMLVICGKEFEAWNYDTYIYGALNIAGYWEKNEITYERIMWLRTWLRENVQHAHDFPEQARSLKGAKLLVDKIIKAEYRQAELQEELKFQLDSNARIFALSGSNWKKNFAGATVLLALLLSSCSLIDEPKFIVDQRLQKYVDCFYREAALRGVAVQHENLIVRLKDIPRYGESHRSDQITVFIDSDFFNLYDPHEYTTVVEVIVFHELGHALLKRSHCEGESIMNEAPPITRYRNKPALREQFIDELFK